MATTTEEKVVVLTIRGRAEGVDQAKAQLKSLGVSYDEVNRRLTEQIPQLDRLAQKYNETYRVQQQYQKQLDQLNRANQVYLDKTGDAARAAQLYQTALTGLNQRHEQTVARLNGVAQGAKLTAYQMQQLSFQINDVVTGLLSGQRPFQILAQQGGQITQVFGGLGSTLRLLVSPIALVVAAVAAVGGAFALGIARAEALDRQLKQLRVTLQSTGGATGISAGDAQQQILGFARAPGVNRDTAQQAARELLQNPLITGDIFQRALPLARDFAAVTGSEIPAAAAKLASALTGGYQAAVQLDRQFQILSTTELDQIRNLEEQGKKTDAARIILSALERQIKGLSDEAMSPLAKSTNDLGNAWDRLLDGLAKTSVIQGAKSALASFLSNIAEIVDPDAARAREANLARLRGQLEETFALIQRIQTSQYSGNVPGYREAATRNLTSEVISLGQQAAGVGAMSDAENNKQLMEALRNGADTAAGAIGTLGNQSAKTKGEVHNLALEAKLLADSLDPAARQAQELLNKLQAFGAVGNLAAMGAAIRSLMNADTPENAAEQAARAAQLAGMPPRIKAGEEALDKELRRPTLDPVSSVLSAFRQRRSAIQGYDAGQGVSAGISASKRIQEAEAEANIEAKYAARIAEASKQGAAAVADMELRLKAAKKAQELYGEAAGQSAAAVDKLAERLYKLDKAAQHDKFVAEFRLATEEIERANTVLEAEIKLVNATPEARAKEIAALKVRNDLLAKGESINEEDYNRRLQAVETQEKLNQQFEIAKKQQEAIAEPFKNAIQSLQSYIVEGLTGGFENAGKAIKGIWKRLMAELAVATVIRPIIVQPIVSVLGGLGLVPQSVVSQYGGGAVGGVLGGGAGGVLGGGGGLGSLLGGSMPGGGLFGGLGSWLNTPIFGTQITDPALIAATGGIGAPLGVSGGLTWGGGLAGLGSIGMGIMGLASGNTIGGGAGILGGGLSLLSGLGAISPAFGPIGMAIGLIGGLLGSLFKKKPKTPQAVSDVSFLDGSWTTSEAMRRGQQDLTGGTGKAGGVLGKALDSITSAYGLNFSEGAMGGYILNSIGKNTGNQWIIGLGSYADAKTGKNGARELQSGIGSAEDAVDMLAAAIFSRNARTGYVAGLSGTQRQIFQGPATFESIDEIKKALDFSKTYDDIVRGNENITAAEKAVRDLNEQFKSLSATAKQYGLDVGIIEQRRQEAINKMATDMNDDYRRRIVGQGPAGEIKLQLEDLAKARDDALKQANYLNTVSGVGANVQQIQQFYAEEFAKMGRGANDNVRRSLLSINDPNALAREDLQRAQEARMQEAQAINAVTPGLIDFNQLIALNNAELAQLEKSLTAASDAAKEAAKTQIEAARDRLRFGGESSAYTLAQQQQNALREYQSLEAAAIRGDPSLDKDRLIGVADQLLALSKERFSIGAGYTDLAQRVERLYNWMLDPSQPMPRYAAGGTAAPGWALVGEQGPELVRFPMAAQVYNAASTAGMLGGGDPELRREVSALREQVATLSSQLSALTAVTAEGVKAQRDTAATNRDMAGETRSQNTRDKSRGAAGQRAA